MSLMKWNPDDFDGDDFGEFDDFDDLDDFEVEATLLTSELTDELTRVLGDRWRAQEENKAISVSITLVAALNKIPAKWLDAACRINRVALPGLSKRNRKTKITALAANLTRLNELTRCVMDMPVHARAALRRIVESGGWLRLSELVRDFGDMDGDGWFWDEQPPTSSLGELRRRALLFIGKAPLTKNGQPSKRMFKVAVVPKDLREMLVDILSNASIRREEESAIAERFATADDLLKDALEAARGHYEHLDWDPPITREDVEGFLRRISLEGFNPMLIWFGLDILLNFLDHYAHEVESPDDLSGYHISELASEFIDRNYLQRWSLEERRNVVEIVRRLYHYLHDTGRINGETLEVVQRACAQINGGKRRLNIIRRPPPLGGELILKRFNPNTGEEERFTYNHQRLVMVWAGEFHQDWRTMLAICENVPGGRQKVALIHELIALEPMICELLISQADDEDFERAIDWFYEERMIELSAW
jgi:hypothetical protein